MHWWISQCPQTENNSNGLSSLPSSTSPCPIAWGPEMWNWMPCTDNLMLRHPSGGNNYLAVGLCGWGDQVRCQKGGLLCTAKGSNPQQLSARMTLHPGSAPFPSPAVGTQILAAWWVLSVSVFCFTVWWPSLWEEACEYVWDHLWPLPVPSCPWSHISLDFVTGLLPSEGKTLVLNFVDCFC